MVDYEHIAYTPTNAARVAEVSRPTLYRWMKLDGFPVARIGGCTRIPAEAFKDSLPAASKNVWMLLVMGVVFFFVYFLLFSAVIRMFNLKTPGREDKAADVVTEEANSNTEEGLTQLATSYIAAVGGTDNLKAIDACITRLRLTVGDSAKVNDAACKRLGGAGLFGREARRGGGVAGHVGQILLRQLLRRLAEFQEAGDRAAAEDVARAGRVDRADLRAAAAVFGLRVLEEAPLRPERHHHELRAEREHAPRALLRAAAPEELHLFVADLHQIRLPQAPEDLLLGLPLRLPERRAVVGVVGDELAVGAGIGDGALGRAAGRLVRAAERTEVQHVRFIEHRGVDLVPAQLRIRAGLAGEGERAVAVRVEGHEGQRRERVRVDPDAAAVDARALHRADEQTAEGVVADLGEESGLFAVGAERRKEVAGRAARIGCQRGIAGLVFGALCQIDQQLAQRDHIIHGWFPLFCLRYSEKRTADLADGDIAVQNGVDVAAFPALLRPRI